MLFNAGLVPGYIVVTHLLQLGDTVWAFDCSCLPLTIQHHLDAFFLKKTIPEAILESASSMVPVTWSSFQICLPLSTRYRNITLLGSWFAPWTTGSTPFFTSRVTTCIHCNICRKIHKKTTSPKAVRPIGSTVSPTERNRSHGHWLLLQPLQSWFVPILPTLLC